LLSRNGWELGIYFCFFEGAGFLETLPSVCFLESLPLVVLVLYFFIEETLLSVTLQGLTATYATDA
jgi:hypothetical protein